MRNDAHHRAWRHPGDGYSWIEADGTIGRSFDFADESGRKGSDVIANAPGASVLGCAAA